MRAIVALTVVGIVLGACRREEISMSGRPCTDSGLCVSGYLCIEPQHVCARVLLPDCPGPSCPSQVTTGGSCAPVDALLPCRDDAYDCELGCRTCEAGGWSECDTSKCVLGSRRSCRACGDDCTASVQNAGGVYCEVTRMGYRCSYGGCVEGYADADGNTANGCECAKGPVEICGDGIDNDCNYVIDEEGAGGCEMYYRDGDGDGYGAEAGGRCLCSATPEYSVREGGDCDDVPSACGADCNPGHSDACDDALDNDCSGTVNDHPDCHLALRYFTVAEGLASNAITAMARGANGDLWVGTSANGGASRLPSGGARFEPVPGLEAKPITTVAVDAAGGVWFGFREPGCDTRTSQSCQCGPTVFANNAATQKCTDFMGSDDNGVNVIVCDSKGEVYWGTDNDYTFESGDIASAACDVDTGGEPVRAMALNDATPRTLWVGTDEGFYTCNLSRSTGGCPDNCSEGGVFPSTSASSRWWYDYISAMVFRGRSSGTGDDELFVGSSRLGLVRYYSSNGAIEVFTTSDGLPSDAVRALAFDEEHDLLYAGTDNGLATLRVADAGSPTFIVAYVDNMSKGLPSNKITALVLESPSVLWIGTGAGVVRATVQRW